MQRFRRGTAAGMVAAACLLSVACTPTTGGGPTPTAQPTATPTPSEDALSRQRRLDFAAAEKAYRQLTIETDKLLIAGGAAKTPSVISRYAAGPYLSSTTKALTSFRETESRQVGTTTIGYVRAGGYSDASLLLDVCEDRSRVTVFIGNKSLGKDGIQTAQVEVRKFAGSWKGWTSANQDADSCA